MLTRWRTSSGSSVTFVQDVIGFSCCSNSSRFAVRSLWRSVVWIRVEVPPTYCLNPSSSSLKSPILPNRCDSKVVPSVVESSSCIPASPSSSSAFSPFSFAMIFSATSSRLSQLRISLTNPGTSSSGQLRMACINVCSVVFFVFSPSASCLYTPLRL
jgi:hypothetical protein